MTLHFNLSSSCKVRPTQRPKTAGDHPHDIRGPGLLVSRGPLPPQRDGPLPESRPDSAAALQLTERSQGTAARSRSRRRSASHADSSTSGAAAAAALSSSSSAAASAAASAAKSAAMQAHIRKY